MHFFEADVVWERQSMPLLAQFIPQEETDKSQTSTSKLLHQTPPLLPSSKMHLDRRKRKERVNWITSPPLLDKDKKWKPKTIY